MRRKTLALPVRVVDWSDTSQILTLFTRELGIVEAIAKGAHRPRNAFQGPFDLGVMWEVVLAERPPERGLAILTEGAIGEGFRGLRRGWASWTAAAYVLEFLRAVGTGGEHAGELFDVAVAALRELDRGGAGRAGEDGAGGGGIAQAVISFEARALRVLGLSAPISSCAECGRPWSGSDRPVFYSASVGGILCGSCRRKDPQRHGVVVPGRAVRVLERLASGGEPAEPEALAPLATLTRELRLFYLEHDFKMLKYVSIFS
jgi:DNA repair protein RecO (recombination protein O)